MGERGLVRKAAKATAGVANDVAIDGDNGAAAGFGGADVDGAAAGGGGGGAAAAPLAPGVPRRVVRETARKSEFMKHVKHNHVEDILKATGSRASMAS